MTASTFLLIAAAIFTGAAMVGFALGYSCRAVHETEAPNQVPPIPEPSL